MIGRFRRFKPKSVRYRPMGPKDFKACRRLVARALASAERPEWAAGLGELDAARRGMKGVSLPRSQSAPASPFGQRLYEGACAVCHAVGGPPLFGSRPSLALNTNLHATTPDNLIQVIVHGITNPVLSDLGYMPAFGDHLSDDQVAELVGLIRSVHEGGTAILWIEHVVQALVDSVDRLICLAGGVIVADGTPREVLADDTVRELYLGQTPGEVEGAA